METRDKLFDKQYYDEMLDIYIEEIEFGISDYEANPNQYKYPEILFYDLFMYQFKIIILSYSSGKKIELIENDIEIVIDRFEAYCLMPNSIKLVFEKNIDDYNKSLWLVSIAILLKVDDQQFNRLLLCIGNEGEDELFEALVATRIKGRKTAKKLIYLKEYHLLLDATKGAHNGINIQQFLLSWYGNMKDCYWYDNHKGKDGGGFFGYWCWEAAAVSVAYNIDDSQFRDLQYYPKDMADYSRALLNE